MTLALSIFALVLSVSPPLVTAGATYADTLSLVRKQLQSEYARYDQMAKRADGKSWVSWYQQTTTPDYTEKQISGKVSTRAQVLEAMEWGASQNGGRTALTIDGKTSLTKVQIRGSTAIADTASRNRVTSDGNPGVLTTVEEKRDTWVRDKGNWKLRRREARKLQIWVNGKLESERTIRKRSRSQ